VGAAKRNSPRTEIIPQLRTFEIFRPIDQSFENSRETSHKNAPREDVPKLLTTGQLNIPSLSSAFPRSLLEVCAGYLEISQLGYLKALA
jgi:hypothetical protein